MQQRRDRPRRTLPIPMLEILASSDLGFLSFVLLCCSDRTRDPESSCQRVPAARGHSFFPNTVDRVVPVALSRFREYWRKGSGRCSTVRVPVVLPASTATRWVSEKSREVLLHCLRSASADSAGARRCGFSVELVIQSSRQCFHRFWEIDREGALVREFLLRTFSNSPLCPLTSPRRDRKRETPSQEFELYFRRLQASLQMYV